MAEIKNYIWIVPLIGGILALVTLLFPAATMDLMGISANLWVWGMYNYSFGGLLSGTDFVLPGISLIVTLMIALGGILLVVSSIALMIKKNQRNVKIFSIIFSIIAGILILVAEVLWLVMVPRLFPMEYYFGPIPPGGTLTFWSMSFMGVSLTLHTVGFGIFGGFISAVIAFISAVIAIIVILLNYYSKDREVIIPEKKETFPTIKEPKASETPELKFCPECGAGIEDPNIQFCGKCGFNLKSPEIAPL